MSFDSSRPRVCAMLALLSVLLGWADCTKRDWCLFADDFFRNPTEGGLERALKGETLKLGVMNFPPFATFKDGEWSGYDLDLFNLVAKRGEFLVEYEDMGALPEGEGFGYLLLTKGRDTDINVNSWSNTPERNRQKFTFTVFVVDSSLFLVAPKPDLQTATFSSKFFTFLRPFQWRLWVVLLIGVVFTALFVWIVEPGPFEDKEAEHDGAKKGPKSIREMLNVGVKNISNLLYQSWVLMTAADNFTDIKTPWAKAHLMSWTGVLCVLLAGYTAELTSFLVLRARESKSIQSLDDLLISGKPACAMLQSPTIWKLLKSRAPSLQVYNVDSLDDMFPAIREGKCAAALMAKGEADLQLASDTTCDMRIVGSSLMFVSGAFNAYTRSCGDFPLKVVDAILQTLREEGEIEEIWDRHARLPLECAETKEQDETSSALSLELFAGTFIITAAFAAVSISGYCWDKLIKPRFFKKINV